MRLMTRVALCACAALLFSSVQRLHAQTIDPVGHFEGSISSPAGELLLQIDLTRTPSGEVVGTLTIPSQKLKGFPLTNVLVKGKDVSFDIASSGGGYFRGELEATGMSGEFSTQMGPFPMALERTSEAHVYAAPANARVSKDIEGVWSGTLDVDGGMRVTLRLVNQPDGTSRGELVSVDENNLTVPVAITQDDATLKLTLPMIGSSYIGTLNADRTEMKGTYTTSKGLALPLSLKRTAAN